MKKRLAKKLMKRLGFPLLLAKIIAGAIRRRGLSNLQAWMEEVGADVTPAGKETWAVKYGVKFFFNDRVVWNHAGKVKIKTNARLG